MLDTNVLVDGIDVIRTLAEKEIVQGKYFFIIINFNTRKNKYLVRHALLTSLIQLPNLG